MKTRTSSSKVNKAWLHDHINDPYVKLAQREGYRARAAYKLKEIDETHRLLRPGQVVVDLGAAPGAWSQYVRRRFAPAGASAGALPGCIIALDLLPMEPVADVEFIQGDFREDDTLEILKTRLAGTRVDLIVSDMAPNLSGVELADAARMSDLIELAADFAVDHLKPQGVLLVKCFHGSGYSQIVERFKRTFLQVAPRKPKASRDKSAETYLLGRGLKR